MKAMQLFEFTIRELVFMENKLNQIYLFSNNFIKDLYFYLSNLDDERYNDHLEEFKQAREKIRKDEIIQQKEAKEDTFKWELLNIIYNEYPELKEYFREEIKLLLKNEKKEVRILTARNILVFSYLFLKDLRKLNVLEERDVPRSFNKFKRILKEKIGFKKEYLINFLDSLSYSAYNKLIRRVKFKITYFQFKLNILLRHNITFKNKYPWWFENDKIYRLYLDLREYLDTLIVDKEIRIYKTEYYDWALKYIAGYLRIGDSIFLFFEYNDINILKSKESLASFLYIIGRLSNIFSLKIKGLKLLLKQAFSSNKKHLSEIFFTRSFLKHFRAHFSKYYNKEFKKHHPGLKTNKRFILFLKETYNLLKEFIRNFKYSKKNDSLNYYQLRYVKNKISYVSDYIKIYDFVLNDQDFIDYLAIFFIQSGKTIKY